MATSFMMASLRQSKKSFRGLSLLLHAADDQTEADGEHHQAEGVDSVHRPRHRDHLLPADLLAAVECE